MTSCDKKNIKIAHNKRSFPYKNILLYSPLFPTPVIPTTAIFVSPKDDFFLLKYGLKVGPEDTVGSDTPDVVFIFM